MLSICNSGLNQFVSFPNFYSINTALSWVPISRKNCLFNYAVFCGHNNVVVVIKFFHTNKGFNFFSWVASNQVYNRSASRRATALWNIINLKPITLSAVGKKEHIIVRVCNKEVFYKIFIFAHSALYPTPSAVLCSICVESRPFNISLVRYC